MPTVAQAPAVVAKDGNTVTLMIPGSGTGVQQGQTTVFDGAARDTTVGVQ